MFGLEGSGFVISISLTFLLIGLITYLFRQQINLLEQKFTTIFELTQTLANSIETASNTKNNTTSIDDNTYIETNNSNTDCPFSGIKVIDMNNPTSLIDNILNTNQHTSETHDHVEINESNTSDSESETDSDSDSETEENDPLVESSETTTETSTELKHTIPLDNDIVTSPPNYNSLKVQELKDLVLKEKLLDEKEIKQLKKQELINILKKSN